MVWTYLREENTSSWLLGVITLAKFQRCIKLSSNRTHFHTKQLSENLRDQLEQVKSEWGNVLPSHDGTDHY